MKKIYFLALFLSVSGFASAVNHEDKTVSIIHSGDTRDCFFFQLEGVSEADPIIPNNGWFAVPFNQISADAKLSILMAAKASSSKVKVITTGAAVCGSYAEVKSILWFN